MYLSETQVGTNLRLTILLKQTLPYDDDAVVSLETPNVKHAVVFRYTD